MRDFEKCARDCPYRKKPNEVMKNELGENTLASLTELFKAIGDPTRVRILWALHNAETCVCDLAIQLNMTQSAISHQLRVLKQTRLVRNRKDGKTVYYSLDDEHIFGIFEAGVAHIRE